MLKINFAGFCLDEVCMCVFGTLMRTCFMFFQKQNKNNNYIYLHTVCLYVKNNNYIYLHTVCLYVVKMGFSMDI